MAARNAKDFKDDNSMEQELTEPEQTPNQKEPEISSDHDAKIAELAYFKAERRGFEPGHELEDWYEAEQEVNIPQE